MNFASPHREALGHALHFPAAGSLSGASLQRNSSPRDPRARGLLVFLARELSSLTPSSRASLLARLPSNVMLVANKRILPLLPRFRAFGGAFGPRDAGGGSA
jgi:hypothetical protein